MKEVISEVFCRFIRKNGKIIYPKRSKYFHFFIQRNEKKDKNDKNKVA